MANRVENLYVRIGNGRAFHVTSENIKKNPASFPVIHFAEILEVHLKPLNEDGSPWSLAELDAFGSYKFATDKDFNRATTNWTLTTSNFTTQNYINTIGDPAFSGTGLNDAISSGTFSGTDSTYTVKIDSVGTPDTFQWRKTTGTVNTAWTAGVNITADNTLSEDVHILFNATTGHTLNDTWTITAVAAAELVCDADAFNTTFDSGIGTKKVVDGFCEWQFLNGTDVDLLIQLPWILKGAIIDPGGSPPTPIDQYVLASNNPLLEATDPTGGDLREGLFWFNTTDNMLRVYDGSNTYNINMTLKP